MKNADLFKDTFGMYATEIWSMPEKDFLEWLNCVVEQEPCDDCISRQAAQDYIAKYLSQFLYNDVREAVETIDEYIGELPSVTPKPKTGKWIAIENEDMKIVGYYCSNCDLPMETEEKTKFCPNCGAKMEVSE